MISLLLGVLHPVLLSFITGCAVTFWLTRLLMLHSPDNVDFADFRRMKAGIYGLDSIPEDIHHECGWRQNKKGQLLFHQRYQKRNAEPRGVVLLCHGFGDHSAGYLVRLALIIAQLGFVVLSIDYVGHGRSDGLHALLPSVDEIAEDVVDFALAALTKEPNLSAKGIFLYGESMGGAVAFKICTAHADKCFIRGIMLMAPMIKISDKFKPSPIIVNIFKKIRSFLPRAPIAPVPDLIDKCFKSRDALIEARLDPLAYQKSPRLQSAVHMMRATDQIAVSMEELQTPVLILHGEADVITCPEISRELYNRCSSTDKTLKVYPDCWHNILAGEPQETRQKVVDDIISWLNAHSDQVAT